MQNSAVAKPPERPKPADSKPAPVAPDFSLDPLPVPDATESDTDTAWGLWQQTLQAHEDSGDTVPHTDFADTIMSQDTTQAPLLPEAKPDAKSEANKTDTKPPVRKKP